MKVLFLTLSLFLGATAVPQFGGLGIPKPPPAAAPLPTPPLAPAVPPPPSASIVPAAALDTAASLPADVAEYTQKINELVELTKTTLTDMGDIAVADNPEVGAQIVAKLGTQITKAAQVFAEYTAKKARLVKREANDGDDAMNEVGGILINSNDEIKPEKEKLSPKAKKDINKRHKRGINDCKADVCRSAAAKLKDAEDYEE